ncbi:hypothetical protein GTZ85_35360 [Streptomyces sp. SID5474]|nr:hypothetical protein [Streptomyces sp. SID5474]
MAAGHGAGAPFAEGLTDRQAADAVRARIGWKYCLGLEPTDPGFDRSVLNEFRDRLVDAEAGRGLLDAVLDAADGRGLLNAAGRGRTDSTHVLSSARELTRLELRGESLRSALNALAHTAPDWLSERARPEWFDHYSTRLEETRFPKSRTKRAEIAERTGKDGIRLLRAVHASDAPPHLPELPAVEILRRVWVQHFHMVDGNIRSRDVKDRPPGATRLVSPHDIEARVGIKRDTLWDGYKVHLTETCEQDAPNLVTQVETTVATVPDMDARSPAALRSAVRCQIGRCSGLSIGPRVTDRLNACGVCRPRSRSVFRPAHRPGVGRGRCWWRLWRILGRLRGDDPRSVRTWSCPGGRFGGCVAVRCRGRVGEGEGRREPSFLRRGRRPGVPPPGRPDLGSSPSRSDRLVRR